MLSRACRMLEHRLSITASLRWLQERASARRKAASTFGLQSTGLTGRQPPLLEEVDDPRHRADYNPQFFLGPRGSGAPMHYHQQAGDLPCISRDLQCTSRDVR